MYKRKLGHCNDRRKTQNTTLQRTLYKRKLGHCNGRRKTQYRTLLGTLYKRKGRTLEATPYKRT